MKSKFTKKIIFFSSVIILIGASFFVYSTMACVGCKTNFETGEFKTISAIEFNNKLREEIVLIDIRTPQEFNSGRIENAENIDFYSSSFRDSLNELDKNKTYLIYCRSGSRSSNALSIMKDLGFSNVYELRGGINSWINSGFPVN